jgi:hypothetical protein
LPGGQVSDDLLQVFPDIFRIPHLDIEAPLTFINLPGNLPAYACLITC